MLVVKPLEPLRIPIRGGSESEDVEKDILELLPQAGDRPLINKWRDAGEDLLTRDLQPTFLTRSRCPRPYKR